MSTIPPYNALVKAGVDPGDAQAAADGAASRNTKDKLSIVAKDAQDLKVRVAVIAAMSSVSIAATLATRFLAIRSSFTS